MRCSLESYILAHALVGSEGVNKIAAKPDQWTLGGSDLTDVRAAIEKLSSEPVMRATPSTLAQLKSGEVVFGPGGDIRDLAAEIMKAVDAGIESGARAKWRKNKYRTALKQASTRIAQQTVKKIAAEADEGKVITRQQIRTEVASAVAEVVESVPSLFRKENVIGFGLFAIGLTLSGLVNVGLMSMTGETSLGTKLAIQGVIGTCMGYLLAVFNPYFNDKMSNQSRALNYKILNGMMSILGETKAEKENAQAIDSSAIQAQLGEVYIAQQALDGRLQGVLGLMIGFCSFIGDSFYKARYILDDEKNPNRLQDACDLMAGIFVTSRLVFYAMKPEFKELFDAYIYSVLEPTLRKHSKEHGQEMFERIMTKIREHKPTPSEETLKKFYEPFVRGALGLDQVADDRDLFTEVKDLLREREAQA
jgi:hypothetical protein